MTDVAEGIPRAIQAITAEEPGPWEVIRLADLPARTIRVAKVVGDTGVRYSFQQLDGSSEVKDVDRLDDMEAVSISPEQALSMRFLHDGQWARRPDIQEVLTKLWTDGLLYDEPRGGIGVADVERVATSGQVDLLSLWVSADGAIQFRQEVKTLGRHGYTPSFDWQQQILPRGTSAVQKIVKHRGDTKPVLTSFYNAHAVAGSVVSWVEQLKIALYAREEGD